MPMSPEAKALYSRIKANEKEQERLEDRKYDEDSTKEERVLIDYLLRILYAAHNRMGWQLTELLNPKPPKKSRNG